MYMHTVGMSLSVIVLTLVSSAGCTSTSSLPFMMPDFSAISRDGYSISSDTLRQGATIVYIPGRGISKPATIFTWIAEYEERWGKIDHRLCLSDGSVKVPQGWIEVRDSAVTARIRERFEASTLIAFRDGRRDLKCVAEMNQKEKVQFILHRIVHGTMSVQDLMESNHPEQFISPPDVNRQLFGESFNGPACVLFHVTPNLQCGVRGNILTVLAESSRQSAAQVVVVLPYGSRMEAESLSHNFSLREQVYPPWEGLSDVFSRMRIENLGFEYDFFFIYRSRTQFVRTQWVSPECEEIGVLFRSHSD